MERVVRIATEDSKYLRILYDSGKNYDYLCQQLKVCISSLKFFCKKKLDEKEHDLRIFSSEYVEVLTKQAQKIFLSRIINLKESGDAGILIKGLPMVSLIVLISAMNVRAESFNFEAVYQTYKKFLIN